MARNSGYSAVEQAWLNRENAAIAERQMMDAEKTRERASEFERRQQVKADNMAAFDAAREQERQRGGISTFSSDGQGGFSWGGNADPWGDALKNQQEIQRQQMIAQHDAIQKASWGEVDGIMKQTRKQKAQQQLAMEADKASIMRAAAENGGSVPEEVRTWFNRKYGGDGQRTGLLSGSGFLQNGTFRLSYGDGKGSFQNEDTPLANQYAISNRYSGIFGDDIRKAQREALLRSGFSQKELASLEKQSLGQQRLDFEKQKYEDKRNGGANPMDDWMEYEKDEAGEYVRDENGNRKTTEGRRLRMINSEISQLTDALEKTKDEETAQRIRQRIGALQEYVQSETDRLTGFSDWMSKRQQPPAEELRTQTDSIRPTFKGTGVSNGMLYMKNESGSSVRLQPGDSFIRNGQRWHWTGPNDRSSQGLILNDEEFGRYKEVMSKKASESKSQTNDESVNDDGVSGDFTDFLDYGKRTALKEAMSKKTSDEHSIVQDSNVDESESHDDDLSNYDEKDRSVIQKARELFADEWKQADAEARDTGKGGKYLEEERAERFNKLVKARCKRDGIVLSNVYKSGEHVFGNYDVQNVLEAAFGGNVGRFSSNSSMQSRKVLKRSK